MVLNEWSATLTKMQTHIPMRNDILYVRNQKSRMRWLICWSAQEKLNYPGLRWKSLQHKRTDDEVMAYPAMVIAELTARADVHFAFSGENVGTNR